MLRNANSTSEKTMALRQVYQTKNYSKELEKVADIYKKKISKKENRYSEPEKKRIHITSAFAAFR